ncbi:hypothetical protein PHLCEN_2v4911, partial [Hermanssonia centrifuga]
MPVYNLRVRLGPWLVAARSPSVSTNTVVIIVYTPHTGDLVRSTSMSKPTTGKSKGGASKGPPPAAPVSSGSSAPSGTSAAPVSSGS